MCFHDGSNLLIKNSDNGDIHEAFSEGKSNENFYITKDHPIVLYV